MKSSTILAIAGASMAYGAALHQKRVLEVVTETDIVYFTVTAGGEQPAQTPDPTTSWVRNGGNHHDPISTQAPPPVVTESAQTTVAPAPTSSEDQDDLAATSTTDAQSSSASPVSVGGTNAILGSPIANILAKPTDFASTAVYHHNLHRVNNSAPAVTWGGTYANYAATVAASCKFAHDLTPGGGGYGQNIAMWASSGDAQALGASTAIAQAITNMWYDGEVDLYPTADYGKANPDMTNFEGWGHYSQVVWVGSQVIGCAAQYCAPGTMVPEWGAWYSVCNYYPPGNMGGQYGKNVLPPLGQGTVAA